jgi:hypothetical protein
MESGDPNRPDNRRSVPFLPNLLPLMTVPLFLGYLIKHFLFPRAVFLVLYNWAIVSVIAVPILCVAECVIIARSVAGRVTDRRVLRPHLLGLGAGVAAMVATFLARSYG